jgi:hypothetical protein
MVCPPSLLLMIAGTAITINNNEDIYINVKEISEEELDEYLDDYETNESDEYKESEVELNVDGINEWERNIDERNEGELNVDNEESNDNETSEEEDSGEEIIIDKSLNNEQIPRTDSDFALYFNNIIETLLFC